MAFPQPIPDEFPAFRPPGGPPLTLVGAATYPPDPAPRRVPMAIQRFAAMGVTPAARRLAPVAWSLDMLFGLVSAAFLVRGFDWWRWAAGLVLIGVLAWLPCLWSQVNRARLLLASGYTRDDLVKWLLTDAAWQPRLHAVRLDVSRRLGWVILWPSAVLVGEAFALRNAPGLDQELLVAETAVALVVTLLAAGTALAPPVLDKRTRWAQARYWDVGSLPRITFVLADWTLPKSKRRVAR